MAGRVYFVLSLSVKMAGRVFFKFFIYDFCLRLGGLENVFYEVGM